MKIIAGICHGMKVYTPKGIETRPTSIRVRAAVMNMLAPYLEQATFCDLCAGSGAIGLEALSRGAHQAFFVEQDPDAISCLERNITELLRRFDAQDLPKPQVKVLKTDLKQVWNKIPPTVDLIWMDPPYAEISQWVSEAAQGLSHLRAGAQWIVEHPSDITLDWDKLHNWEPSKNKRYGRTEITILERRQT